MNFSHSLMRCLYESQIDGIRARADHFRATGRPSMSGAEIDSNSIKENLNEMTHTNPTTAPNGTAEQEQAEGRALLREARLRRARGELAAAGESFIPGSAPGSTIGANGFSSLGEFAIAARTAALNKTIDPRLLVKNSPSTRGNEGTGADGGFAVPPDFRAEIAKQVNEASLLPFCAQLDTTSSTVIVPTDNVAPWSTSNAPAWRAEGSQQSEAKPVLSQLTMRLDRLSEMVLVTDELLEDTPALAAYLTRSIAEKMSYALNRAILAGSGVGAPLGILNSGALISVAAESMQTSATITLANLTSMWSAMTADSRSRATWIVNGDVDSQLVGMMATAPGLYTGSSLFGRPIFRTEAAEPVGTPGDIVLADLSSYLIASKGTAPTQELSIHLWFDYDIGAFRFSWRIGGMPMFDAPITRRDSSTCSPFVALAART